MSRDFEFSAQLWSEKKEIKPMEVRWNNQVISPPQQFLGVKKMQLISPGYNAFPGIKNHDLS